MSHVQHAPTESNLSPETVIEALPKPLRGAFRAYHDEGFVRVEHIDRRATKSRREEQIKAAEQALIRRKYQVWPDGSRLEVSRRRVHEENFSIAFADQCDEPTPFTCRCRDTVPMAEVA